MLDKLRFKDENGQDYPEWEEYNLGAIGFFKTSSIDKKIYENEIIVRLVNYMDVYNKKTLNNQTVNSLDKTSAKENQLIENALKKGDILFTPSSETPEDIGHSVVIIEDLPNTVYSYHLVRFRPMIDKLDVKYSNYFCNNNLVRSQIVAKATGSTRFTVSIKDFNNIIVKIPSINEQQKIADFLSTVDEKIENQKEIVANWEEIKKGLIQKIFSQELRFKDENGQDYPEWEEKFLSECGKFRKGKGLSKDDISNTGNDCILYGDLYTKYKEVITFVENKTETKIINPTLSKKGDILFPGSTTASALSLIAPSSIKQNNVIIGGDIIVFTPNNDINSDFLSYQINHFRKSQFAKYAEGITIVHIYSNLLGKNIISTPSIKEQQKIADFLSTVDKKIECEKNMLNELTELKKGLLQRIFT